MVCTKFPIVGLRIDETEKKMMMQWRHHRFEWKQEQKQKKNGQWTVSYQIIRQWVFAKETFLKKMGNKIRIPGDLVSFGMMQRTKWGIVERRVVINLFNCSYGLVLFAFRFHTRISDGKGLIGPNRSMGSRKAFQKEMGKIKIINWELVFKIFV